MNPTVPNVDIDNLVFTSWKEVKHKAEPNNYIEFFLITDTGNEVLAISAEDHGNSHYGYQSTGAFTKYGMLNSKNRAETISWLEMLVKESQTRTDCPMGQEGAHVGEPTPDNPLGIYFTQHKVEKTANPDGTHTQRFFLLDQYGNWHLAVLGEERETRDGHYLYSATDEFSARYPLHCHAQKDVIHWLEQRITHHLPHPTPPHPTPPHPTPPHATPPPAPQLSGPHPAASAPHGLGTAAAAAAALPAGQGLGGHGGGGASGPSTGAVGSGSCAHVDSSSGGSGWQQQQQQALQIHVGQQQQAQEPSAQTQYSAVPQGFQLQPQGQVPGLGMQTTTEAAAGGVGRGAGEGDAMPQQPQLQFMSDPGFPTTSGEQTMQTFPMAAWNGLQQQQQTAALTPPLGGTQAFNLQAQTAPGLWGTSQSLTAPPVALQPPQQGSQLAAPQQQQCPVPNQLDGLYAVGQQQQPPPPLLQPSDAPAADQHVAAGSGPVGAAPDAMLHQFPQQLPLAQPQHGSSQAPPFLQPGPSPHRQQQQQPAQQPHGTLQKLGEGGTPAMQQGQFQHAPSTAVAAMQQPQQQYQQLPFPMQLQQQQQQQFQGQPPLLPPLSQSSGQLSMAGSMPAGAGMGSHLAVGSSGPVQMPGGAGAVQLAGNAGMQLPSGNGSMQLPMQFQPSGPGGSFFQPLAPQQQHPQNQLQPLAQQIHLQQYQQQQQQLQQLLQGTLGSFGINAGQLQPPPALQAGQPALPTLQLPSPNFSSLPPLQGAPGAGWPPACGTPGSSMGLARPQAQALDMGSSMSAPAGGPPLPPLMQQTQPPTFNHAGSTLPGMGPVPGLGPFGQLNGAPPVGSSTAAANGVAGSSSALPPAPPLLPGMDLSAGLWTPDPSLFGSVSLGSMPAGFPPQPLLPQLPAGQPSPLPDLAGTGGGGGGPAPDGSGASLAALGLGPTSAQTTPGLMMPPAVGFTPNGAGGGGLPQPFATPTGVAALPAVRTKEGGPGGTHPGGRGGAGGRGSGSKHKLAGVAEVAHKRKLARIAAAGEEAVRAAQGAYLASLRHAALSEAAQQESLRKAIANWVRGQISEDEMSVSGWQETLEQMLRDADGSQTVATRYLSTDRLLQLTRSSAGATALRAAQSVAGPHDNLLPGIFTTVATAGGAGTASAAAPGEATAAVHAAVAAPAVLPPLPAAAVSAAPVAAAPEAAAAPVAEAPSALPFQAEALAAVSSLKALLLEDFDGSLFGGLGSSGGSGLNPTADSGTLPAGALPAVATAAEATPAQSTGALGAPPAHMQAAPGTAAAAAAAPQPVQAALAVLGAHPNGQQEQHAPGQGLPPGQPPQQQLQLAPGEVRPAEGAPPLSLQAHAGGSAAAPTGANAPVPAAAPALAAAPAAANVSTLQPAASTTPAAAAATTTAVPSFLATPAPTPSVPASAAVTALQLTPSCAVPLPALPPPPAPAPTQPPGPMGSAATVACAGTASSWAFKDPHLARHGARAALESLREVAALCPPVASMATSKLVDTVKQYVSHPHPAVSGLAADILKRWRGTLVHRLRSMADSRCYQDPVAALEARIQANEITFPNWGDLPGVPRGSSVSAPEGPAAGAAAAGAPGTAAGAAVPALAAPSALLPGQPAAVTPSAVPQAGAAGGFTPAGAMVAFATTPTPAVIAPALAVAPLGQLTPDRLTPLPNGALGVAAPAAATAATPNAVGTPRGLFDSAAAGAGGQASVPTPQLFRPGSAAAFQTAAAAAAAGAGSPTPVPQMMALTAPSPAAAAAAPAAPTSPAAAPAPLSPRAAATPAAAAGVAVADPLASPRAHAPRAPMSPVAMSPRAAGPASPLLPRLPSVAALPPSLLSPAATAGGASALVAAAHPLASPQLLPRAKATLPQPVEAAAAVALAQATRRLAATLRQGGGEAPSAAELMQIQALAASTSAYIPLKRQSASHGPSHAAGSTLGAGGVATASSSLNAAVAVAESALQQRISQLQQHGLGVNMRLGGPVSGAVPLFLPPASSSTAVALPAPMRSAIWPALPSPSPSPASQPLPIPPLQLPPMQSSAASQAPLPPPAAQVAAPPPLPPPPPPQDAPQASSAGAEPVPSGAAASISALLPDPDAAQAGAPAAALEAPVAAAPAADADMGEAAAVVGADLGAAAAASAMEMEAATNAAETTTTTAAATQAGVAAPALLVSSAPGSAASGDEVAATVNATGEGSPTVAALASEAAPVVVEVLAEAAQQLGADASAADAKAIAVAAAVPAPNTAAITDSTAVVPADPPSAAAGAPHVPPGVQLSQVDAMEVDPPQQQQVPPAAAAEGASSGGDGVDAAAAAAAGNGQSEKEEGLAPPPSRSIGQIPGMEAYRDASSTPGPAEGGDADDVGGLIGAS